MAAATRSSEVITAQLSEVTGNLRVGQIATLLETHSNGQRDLAANQVTTQAANDQLGANLASLVDVTGTANTSLAAVSTSLQGLATQQIAAHADADRRSDGYDHCAHGHDNRNSGFSFRSSHAPAATPTNTADRALPPTRRHAPSHAACTATAPCALHQIYSLPAAFYCSRSASPLPATFAPAPVPACPPPPRPPPRLAAPRSL